MRVFTNRICLFEQQLAAEKIGEKISEAIHLVELSLRRDPAYLCLVFSEEAEHNADRALDEGIAGLKLPISSNNPKLENLKGLALGQI